MNSGEKTGGFFSIISFLSGASLVCFGLLSLLIVAFSFSWWGLFVSWALLVHGVLELVARHGVLSRGSFSMAKLMVRNQLLLALSVSLYAFGMIYSRSDEGMSSELLKEALALYPAELRQTIDDFLPLLHWVLYGAVIIVVCIGCASTAWYYYRKTRHLVE